MAQAARTNDLIIIEWHGPFTLEEVVSQQFSTGISDGKIEKPSDLWQHRGLYQIYGDHPVYGSDQLLYIGMTTQSFPDRLRSYTEYDFGSAKLSIYLGYLRGDIQPSDEAWKLQIRKAEAILINAHAPAWNSQFIGRGIPEWACSNHEHVINLGRYRRLLHEVSVQWYDAYVSEAHERYRWPHGE